jgi:phenylpropionate dioxygenase-like ring-hydroxylating dioxygenase large terminal subunit
MDTLIQTLSRRYWHLVAHRGELAMPGDYVRLDWPLGELVIYNDESQLVAFDNVCPHRGGLFFSEDSGNARAVCPYHGWSYRGGEVKPSRRDLFEGCDLTRARLNTYSLEAWGDFLFVAVDPAMSLADQLDELGPEIAAFSRNIEARRDFYAIDFQAPWRVAMENALESYHVNMVHPTSFARLSLTRERQVFAGLNSVSFAEVGSARMAQGLKRQRRSIEASEVFEGFFGYYLFPYAMISSTYGLTYAVQNFFPSRDAPNRTQFYTRLLSARAKPGAAGMSEAMIEANIAANRQIFDEDHAACRRVSSTFDLTDPRRIYAATEQRVRRLDECLRQIAPKETRAIPALVHAVGRGRP